MKDKKIKNTEKINTKEKEDVSKKFGAELNFATREAYALLRANLSFSLIGK